MLFFACGCSSQTSKKAKTIDQPLTDQVIQKIIDGSNKKYEIASIEQSKDTLRMIIANRIIYYPFGRASKVSALASIDPHFKVTQEQSRNKFTRRPIKLFKLYYKESYLKFFIDSESGFLEMTSGNITNSEVTLPGSVRIGMPFADFIGEYLEKRASDRLQSTKVVELVSGLEGIWEYYNFEEGKLSSVRIKTDYTFEN